MPTPVATESISEEEVAACNKEVETAIVKNERQTKQYCSYSAKERASIGRYAAQHGPTAAARHFSKLLGHPVPESTARKFRNLYRTELETNRKRHAESLPSISELPPKKRGRPLLIGDFDSPVQDYIRMLRLSGGVVNARLVVAAAIGLIAARNRSLLVEYGGNLNPDKGWAQSLLRRMGYVKRKASTSARIAVQDFEGVKIGFLERIVAAVKNSIPQALVINLDETGLKLVPVSSWTLEQQGTAKIKVAGVDDKREITAVVAASMTGDLLPLQLLYTGVTERCHPAFSFPDDWDVWHSSNHWANESTTLRYIDKVLTPYVRQKRKDLGLPDESKALLLWDVFRAHRTGPVLEKLKTENIEVVFIPANCTSELQPLDLSVNKPLKDHLKTKFTQWYADQVSAQLASGKTIEAVKINMCMSVIKPTSANWILFAYDCIRFVPNVVCNGFCKAGIVDALKDV